MVAKRMSRPVQQPADAARGVAKKVTKRATVAAKTVTKKAVAKKAVAKKVVRKKAATKTTSSETTETAAKAATMRPRVAKANSTPAPTESASRISDGIVARKRTIAKTQCLVDQSPIAVDDTDAVAKASIATKASRKLTRVTKVPGGRVRRSAVDRLDDPPPATGSVLIDRVSRAIERELTQIEVIVGNHHVPPRQRTEAERRARTLASLARTLREVMLLRAGDRKAKGEDDDAVPRDLTQLRLELARRMDRLVAEAKAAHPEPPK